MLVEQHARQVLPMTDKAIVLEQGRIVHQGEAAALAADPKLWRTGSACPTGWLKRGWCRNHQPIARPIQQGT